MRRELLAAAFVLTLGVTASADEYPDPLLCGHRITSAYIAGLEMSCFVGFGRKGHMQKIECAKRPMKIIEGKLGVSGMGEVKGTVTIEDRKKRSKADVRGWISFSGNLTVAMQKTGDWRVHGLAGTAKIRPTCAGMETVFEEVRP